MAAAVISVTRPADTRDFKLSNRKAGFRDISADTGDYAAGGFTLTAAQLIGFKHIDVCIVASAATEGTSGANAQLIGVTYPTTGGAGTTVKFQVYESAATGLPPLEKTAEPYPANFIFRVYVIGT